MTTAFIATTGGHLTQLVALAERIGDRQAVCESSLLLAEAVKADGQVIGVVGIIRLQMMRLEIGLLGLGPL